MFYTIETVKPLDDFTLYVTFKNGVNKLYDLKPLFNNWESFKDLKNNNLYKLVNVDVGGYGISWNENIDLSCNELWENGQIIKDNNNLNNDYKDEYEINFEKPDM